MKKQLTVYPFDKLRAGSLQFTDEFTVDFANKGAALTVDCGLWTVDSLTGGQSL